MNKSVLVVLFLAVMLGMVSMTWARVSSTFTHQQSEIFGLSDEDSFRDYGAMNNPDYYYAAIKSAPSGVFYRQAGFNPARTKIVAQKSFIDGANNRIEIVLMDANGQNEQIISAGNSGTGGLYGYMNPFWSDDGSVVGYAEVPNSGPNKIVTYDLSTYTNSYIYEPSVGDACNPDFIGNSTTAIVFWDWITADNAADLFTWDGTTLTNITNSPLFSEYEPNSNNDGSVILYWSGETTTELVNTTHTLTYSGGSWVVDLGFDAIEDTYWSFWSGQNNNNIGVVVMSTKDVHIYDSTGDYLFDVTGSGYSGGSGQWNFIGFNYEGNNGEILLTSNAGRTEAGRDIIIANRRNALFVNDVSGNNLFPGTVQAPFKSISKAITEAVAGGVIQVATGIYQEQLHITTNNISILGAGQANTTVLSPDILPLFFGTNSKPVVYADGVETFTIKDLTIDGNGAGNNNYRFMGLAFWNAGGTVDNVGVLRIQDTPISGAQHGVGVYAYNDTSGPYTIACSNMTIEDYQKNAMALSGVGLTVDLDNITTIGAGPTAVTAQNGIQIGFGAGGTVDDCDVSGNIYTGSSWSAAGILGYNGAPITVTDTDVADNTTGVDMNDTSCSITGGSVSNTDSEAWDGIYFRNPSVRSTDSSFGRTIYDAQPIFEEYTQDSSRTNFTFDLEDVDVVGSDKADSWGIYIRAYGNTIIGSMTQCDVSNWAIGIYTRESGGTVQLTANQNYIHDNLDHGFYSNTATTQDATYNWWGDATGPYHDTTNPDGLGNAVSDNVEYDPWWGDDIQEDLHSEEYIVNQTQNTTYNTIQAAINAAGTGREGDLIEVPANTYVEDIRIDRACTLRGEDAETTIISGPIGGNTQTVLIDYSNVTFENFTVTREGNNTTDWNNSGTNQTGLQITQQKTGCLVQNCIFTENRNALYFNDCQGNTLINNMVTNNRTGIQLVNNVSNFVIEDNTITDNWTMGILLYYSGVVTPTTGISIEDNEISGNWYSQIECKTVGTNPTTSYDCTPNWFGMASPYAVTTLAGEPGYAAQIPIEFGGDAANPGVNEGKITGQESAKVIFDPWWINEEMTILSSEVDLFVDADDELIHDGENQNYAVKISNITNLRSFEIYVSYPDAYFGDASEFFIGPAFTAAAAAAPDGGMTLLYPELISAGNYKVTGSFLGGIPEGGHGVSGTDVTLFTFDLSSRVDVDNVALHPTYSVVDLGNVVLKDIMNPYHVIGFDETTGFTVIIDSTEPTMVALTEPSGLTLAIDPAKSASNGFASVVDTFLGLTFNDNYNLDDLMFKIQAAADDDPGLIGDFASAISLDLAAAEYINGAWQLPDATLNAEMDNLPTGSYEVWFLAVDDAGNYDIWSWSFLIDKDALDYIVWEPLADATHNACRTTPKQNNSINLMYTNPVGAENNHIWAYSYSSRCGEAAYPEYPGTTNPIPAAPNPYNSAPQNGWTRVAVIPATGTPTWSGMERDYYYITVFVEDAAGNMSAAPATPFYRESISYWPGDVTGTADGIAHTVTSLDVALLSAHWGATPGDNTIDVGPTTDHGRRSRPTPDNVINIEDLMIFAMNYNNTVYTFYHRDGEVPAPISIETQFAYVGDLLNVSFILGGNNANLRGLNIPLGYGNGLTLESVITSDIWPEGSVMLFTDKDNMLTLSLSTLGESAVEGNGTIATVSFKIVGNALETELLHMIARDIDNNEIEILNNPTAVVTDNDDQVNVIPDRSYLGDAYPNPFNPSTTLRYGLKQAGSVRISIYNNRGQLVNTLINDTKAAGTYTAVWNGKDNTGRGVSSGLYFVRMETKEHTQIKKILMLK